MRHAPLLRLGAVGSVLVLGIPGCGSDEPTTPSSGEPVSVTVSLATPNVDDGALLIVVRGAGPPSIQPVSNTYQVYWRLAKAGETRVIVVGHITAGPLFTAGAGPGASAAEITASVEEVATRTNELRASTTGYILTLSR
ncbi:MAG TPA: hypothetical protein PKA66_12570 [Gemmatimonadales bacterium]|nr:hypothetical protein [Gemmatimonadales bacterium]